MYCSKCGNQINDEAVICPNCGCPTENYISYNQATSSSLSQNIQKPKKIISNEEDANKEIKKFSIPILILTLLSISPMIISPFASNIVDDYYPYLFVLPVISFFISIPLGIIKGLNLSKIYTNNERIDKGIKIQKICSFCLPITIFFMIMCETIVYIIISH